MAWPTIDPTSPAANDKVKFGDDKIREAKQNTIDGLSAISNYSAAGSQPALKTAVWTTAGRPTGANLVDRVTGFNSDVGYEEYYDIGTMTWKPKGIGINGGTLTGAINEAKSVDIASAATADIGAATGNYVNITGATTITNLGTVQAGTRRIVRFTGSLILTYNATSLILPGAANIITAVGDTAEFISLGSGNWICIDYRRASGNVPISGGVTMTGALGILNAAAAAQPIALGQLFGSISQNGYIKLPIWNGSSLVTAIIQWGWSGTMSPTMVYFPIPFPNLVGSIVTTVNYSPTAWSATVSSVTLNSFVITMNTGVAVPGYWLAIGY